MINNDVGYTAAKEHFDAYTKIAKEQHRVLVDMYFPLTEINRIMEPRYVFLASLAEDILAYEHRGDII